MTEYDYGIGKILSVSVNPNPVDSNGSTVFTVKIKNVGTGWSYFTVGLDVEGQETQYGQTDGLYINEEKTYTFNVSGIFTVHGFGVACWMFNYDLDAWRLDDTHEGILYPYTSTAPPSGEGFDVLEWFWNGILGLFEGMLGFISGGFITFLSNLKAIFNAYSTDIVNFFADPISKVRSWVLDLIPTLQDWWNDILTGVGTWWDSTRLDVLDWINDATSMLEDVKNAGYASLGAWWNSNIQPTIDLINTKSDEFRDLIFANNSETKTYIEQQNEFWFGKGKDFVAEKLIEFIEDVAEGLKIEREK